MIKNFEEFINEGLIKTYPIEKIVDYIKKKYNLTDDNIAIRRGNYGDSIDVDLDLDDETKKGIEKDLKMGGYFISNTDYYSMTFSKLFDEEVTGKIEDKYLYHITLSINDKKIQSQGLVPKHKNKKYNYPERVFLLSERNLVHNNFFKYFSQHLYSMSNKKYNEYSVYKIKYDDIKNIRLFKASNAYDYVGYYTTENIKPDFLEKINTIITK